MSSPEETNGKPVIRDLRRIDPATGQVRDSGQGGSAQPGLPRAQQAPWQARGLQAGRCGQHGSGRPGRAWCPAGCGPGRR